MKPALVSVLSRPPHDSRDGLAIRNFHLLSGLSEFFRVRALSLSDPERLYAGQWPAGVEFELVPQTPRTARRIAAAAGSLFAGGAYSERLYRSADLARRAARLCAAERPKWVVAHAYHVAPAALGAGVPAWIDFHNLDSEIWRRTAEMEGRGFVRAFARLQADRVAALERSLADAAAGVSCVSARDAKALRALGVRHEPLVVPNGVDLERHARRRAPASSEMVFFVGDLSWPPNADGVRWFLREVWPRVRSLRPSARAEILGREAPADLARLAGEGVALLGEGGDARDGWARASVAIVPLRAGGGTRLKILEAAASGVPVVSTSIGAEGLEFGADEIRIRDEAGPFAEAVAGLLGDAVAAARQAGAARSRVEGSYGWGPIARAFALELARRAGVAA